MTRPLLKTTKNTKIILKKIAQKYFGSEFIYRPKGGFHLPLGHFFQSESFQTFLNENILPGMKSRGIFNPKLIPEHLKDKKYLNIENIQAIWTLISFELWAQTFLDKKGLDN